MTSTRLLLSGPFHAGQRDRALEVVCEAVRRGARDVVYVTPGGCAKNDVVAALVQRECALFGVRVIAADMLAAEVERRARVVIPPRIDPLAARFAANRAAREACREALRADPLHVRLEVFDEIARDFFRALDHNIRTRSLIFGPFYHPLGVLRSLRPSHSRMEVLQADYDTFFYDGDTLDQLPAVTPEQALEIDPHLVGAKLVINTTSLMTGERVAFAREPVSGLRELKKINQNALRLSRVVGASSCVPGLLPPTSISGELLVDGGVSDNQGIAGLLYEGLNCREGEAPQDDYDLLLVSDASGQIDQLDRMRPSTTAVLGRTVSVLQHQVRNRMIDRLRLWKEQGQPLEGIAGPQGPAADGRLREFAFVHLHLNVKGRPGVTHRLPTEYIGLVGRVRTDLDQFSLVERDALMWHGYTLIEAQLRQHCRGALARLGQNPDEPPAMHAPPLFAALTQGDRDAGRQIEDRRQIIQKDLRVAGQASFILRSLNKYPGLGWGVIGAVAAGWLLVGGLMLWLWLWWRPGWLGWAAYGVVMAALLYVACFVAYELLRPRVARRDLEAYRAATGHDPPYASG